MNLFTFFYFNKSFKSVPKSENADIGSYFHAINMLVAIGFISAFFSFIAHIFWNYAAERQITRIKYYTLKKDKYKLCILKVDL